MQNDCVTAALCLFINKKSKSFKLYSGLRQTLDVHLDSCAQANQIKKYFSESFLLNESFAHIYKHV